jgi:hypothetical protein
VDALFFASKKQRIGMPKKFLILLILFVTFISTFAAGCTANIAPTVTTSSTPTPTPDYTNYFNTDFVHKRPNDVWSVAQNFTRSKNERGNDVYFGVIRNESYTPKYELTMTIEIAKSKDEAKQIYSQTVISKANDGYIPYTALRKQHPEGDSWYGNKERSMALIDYYTIGFPSLYVTTNATTPPIDYKWVVTVQTGGVQ